MSKTLCFDRILNNKFTLESSVDFENETITLTHIDQIKQKHVTLVLETKETAIRKALIELGWTPPTCKACKGTGGGYGLSACLKCDGAGVA